MSYALFVEDVQVSRALPTRNDVWHYADDAGLVVDALIQDETGKPGACSSRATASARLTRITPSRKKPRRCRS